VRMIFCCFDGVLYTMDRCGYTMDRGGGHGHGVWGYLGLRSFMFMLYTSSILNSYTRVAYTSFVRPSTRSIGYDVDGTMSLLVLIGAVRVSRRLTESFK
jgi:hypothetical protein